VTFVTKGEEGRVVGVWIEFKKVARWGEQVQGGVPGVVWLFGGKRESGGGQVKRKPRASSEYGERTSFDRTADGMCELRRSKKGEKKTPEGKIGRREAVVRKEGENWGD